MYETEEFKEAFYAEDRKAYSKVAPIITQIFKERNIPINIKETTDGDRVDIYLTATTKVDDYVYIFEVKDRKEKYTFQRFWDAEEGYLSKDEFELTKDEKTFGPGIYIKQNKIQALLNRAGEDKKAFYCVNFPDNVLALWEINEFTEYGETWSTFEKYNVHPGHKTKQHLFTLSLHKATFIYNYNITNDVQ